MAIVLAGCETGYDGHPCSVCRFAQAVGMHEPRRVQRSTQCAFTIGATTLSATLHDNPTARAFRTMLPLTLNMTDVNANEKYGRLPKSLPVDASNPGTIQARI